jgi:hypothetical protein
MKKISYYIIAMLLPAALLVTSCDLTEEIPDGITEKVVKSDPGLLSNLLAPPLGQLRGLWLRENFWGQQEATSDELFFPTRGTDWFDGGVWEDDYFHTWSPTHRDVVQTWNLLNSAISASNVSIATLGIESASDLKEIVNARAQLKFLRCFYEYALFDLWRVYPYRDPFDNDFLKAPAIMTETQGFYHIVSVAKEILPDMKLRDDALYGEPNRDAVLMLLAKMYLNKEVYIGVSGYDSSLIYLNELINTGHYGLANNYFDMFSVDNDKLYKKADDEAILVAVLDDHDDYGLDNRVVWVTPTFHYNQTLGGRFTANWNGNCVPEGFLMQNWIAGTDTATDSRWRDSIFYDEFAVVLGFNYGKQYKWQADSLVEIKDRPGNPLNFTFECPFATANEDNGVRVLKYPPRIQPINVMRTPNDFVIWRYADALLMKAECLVRAENKVAEAVALVNELRDKRHAPEISAGTSEEMLSKILIERGLELYWEGHRRQDMIRFGTFLLPKSGGKNDMSPETAILLPVPQAAIDGVSDGSLKQNPGY